MGVNGGLNVLSEIGIGHWRNPKLLFIGLRQRKALADFSARAGRCCDYSNRTVILFYNHLDALPHFEENSMDIASEFLFCDAKPIHIVHHYLLV